MAFRIPAALDLLCFVKKLTVIGIIGNTQGVSKAANPLKKDKMKMSHMDFPPSSSSFFEFEFFEDDSSCSAPLLSDISLDCSVVSLFISVALVSVSSTRSSISGPHFLTLNEKGTSCSGRHLIESQV